jgi:polyisoprenoid-binding protein YceI
MQRTGILFTLAIGVLGWARVGGAVTWEIDPSHSSVEFSVRHMMVSNVRGQFTKFTGAVEVDPSAPAGASVKATIEAASVDTGNEKRDEHLRGADFFEVAKYPQITFVSKQIQAAGDKKWKLTGALTMHGVTKDVVLDVEGPSGEIKDPWGKTRTGARATGTINRKDFGIAFAKTLDGGGLMVGEEIAITLEIEAMQK